VLLFAIVATLACWRPARAAARVDPVETLKVE
jgi:ABC-type lipoprotein release transport system permease subunit